MSARLPLLLLADGRQHDGRTLLTLARRQGAFVLEEVAALAHWLQLGATPFLLLAHGALCVPALELLAADLRCRAALLLSPQGDPLAAPVLPFPALVACHRPDPRYPRLTQAASLAAVWQAQLHLLSGRGDDAAELSPLLADLIRLASQPLAGEC